MNAYSVRNKKDGWVMAQCCTKESAERYLSQTLPDYIKRGFLVDKTLTADDFHVVANDGR